MKALQNFPFPLVPDNCPRKFDEVKNLSSYEKVHIVYVFEWCQLSEIKTIWHHQFLTGTKYVTLWIFEYPYHELQK